MDRALRIANSLGEEEDAHRFAMLRDKIKETIIEKGHDKQSDPLWNLSDQKS